MTDERAETIAVIVVHGVADQQPKVSARQISNLLTDFTGEYPAGFTEQEIRVPLEPVLPVTKEKESFLAKAFDFEERSGTQTRGTGNPLDYDFMREQLRSYEPRAGEVFETLCLEGKRSSGDTIHVYEAYWADLSKLRSGVGAFLGELYQLILHLPSLGRTVVNGERASRTKKGPWHVFSFFQTWLVRWLTLFIAPINLAMLTFVLPLVATRIETLATVTLAFGAAVGVAVLGAAAVTGLVLRKRKLHRIVWATAPFVAATVAMLVASAFIDASTPTHVVMFELWLISALIAAAVLVRYNAMRPGALGVGGLMLLTVGVLLTRELVRAKSWFALPEAALRVVEYANLGLQVSWRIHVPWFILTMLVAVVCIAVTRDERWRSVRASWVAIVTVGLATTVFAVLTPAFWSAILKTTTAFLPNDAPYKPLPPLPRWLGIKPAPANTTIGDWVQFAVLERAAGAFVLETIVLIAFFMALIWSIFPSVIVEASPSRDARNPRRAIALGRWLTNGLGAIPWAALLVPGVFVAMVFGGLMLERASTSAVVWAGGAVLALAAARFWLPGASSTLDVALDVDNYLREHPRNATPRARIAERICSLLRYVHGAPRHYDRTIIIAHSQGSVILADLLRFLRNSGISFTNGPVDFFTMGSPLRQLYARAFSPLYQWMDPEWEATQTSNVIDDYARPDPETLGVRQWINAYFSGDYVGRNLWCNRAGDDRWDLTASKDRAGRREEFCLGEGAHTHYWDRNGGAVAKRLDALISGS